MKPHTLSSSLFIWLVMAVYLFIPFFSASAASDLAVIWSQQNQAPISSLPAIDTQALGDFAIFLIYLFLIIGGIFAITTIMIGYLKMFLASGNDDDHHGAQHSFITGIIVLVLAVVFYISLGSVLVVVKGLAARLV